LFRLEPAAICAWLEGDFRRKAKTNKGREWMALELREGDIQGAGEIVAQVVEGFQANR
jgi:hypothetical protein